MTENPGKTNPRMVDIKFLIKWEGSNELNYENSRERGNDGFLNTNEVIMRYLKENNLAHLMKSQLLLEN